MKKTRLPFLFIALLGYITVAYGQPETKLGYGIRAGGNLTGRMIENNAITAGNRELIPNFHAGVLVDIPLSSDWHLQPELQYLRSGYKSSLTTSTGTYDTTQRVSYLNIPIAFNYYFRNINVKPYISMGPYIGYALSGTVKSDVTVNGETTECSHSVDFGKSGKDHLKRFDAGIMLGVGMDLDLLCLEFKYGQSLLNVYTGKDDASYSMNMNLALSILFIF